MHCKSPEKNCANCKFSKAQSIGMSVCTCKTSEYFDCEMMFPQCMIACGSYEVKQ